MSTHHEILHLMKNMSNKQSYPTTTEEQMEHVYGPNWHVVVWTINMPSWCARNYL